MAKKKKKGSEFDGKTEAQVLELLNKKYQNAIITERKRYDFYPSGLAQWDAFLGGLPRGTIMEIFGPEESGKTTLALEFVSACQRADPTKKALYLDYEDVIDLGYAANLCDISRKHFLLSQPESLEQGWNLTIDALGSLPISCVVIDSIAAMVPEAELMGEVGDHHMGVVPRKIGQALRMTLGLIRRKKIVGIFINQTRMKIGVVFGNPETTPGGQSIKFRSAIRARLSKSGSDAKRVRGFENSEFVTCKLLKNKISGRKKSFNWLVTPNIGIEKEEEMLRAAVDYRVFDEKTEGKGKGFYYKGKNIGSTRLEVCSSVLRKEKNKKLILDAIME